MNLKAALQLIDQAVQAFPATNSDGSSNAKAQADALKGVIDAAAANSVIDIASFGITLPQLEGFAVAVAPIITAYLKATGRPSL